MQEQLKEIIIEAGKKSLNFFNLGQKMPENFISMKSDHSPVTIADLEIDEFLRNSLKDLTSHIIITEELPIPAFVNQSFWLIDPIDGTRDFIKGRSEFTINIALIENQKPVIGLIYQPCEDLLYFTENGQSFRQNAGKKQKIQSSKKIIDPIFISGRRQEMNEQNVIQMSSSLKFCKIADQTADIYIMKKSIMEWDIAAGQAILENAGGVVLGENLKILPFGKEKFIHAPFIAAANFDLAKEHHKKL